MIQLNRKERHRVMTAVTIISGFLGAGKTTLIREFMKKLYAKEQIVLIENEFGEIGIDAAFLENTGIAIKEINSGCICCSLVGDFKRRCYRYWSSFILIVSSLSQAVWESFPMY